MLARDFNNGTLANGIPSPPSAFHEVESILISEDELVLHCSHLFVVVLISSEIMFLGLHCPHPPYSPPLTLIPLALPFSNVPMFPMLASIAPKQKSSPVALL